MRAFFHHLARYCLGLWWLVSPGLTWAIDCPTQNSCTLISGWNTAESPSSASSWAVTQITSGATVICGVIVNNSPVPISSSGHSYASARSYAEAQYFPLGYTNLHASCATSSGGNRFVWLIWTNAGGTRVGARLTTTITATPCDQPPSCDDDCEEFANQQEWISAEDMGPGFVPPETACVPMGAYHCEVFRRGKLNDGTTSCIPGTTLGCEPVEYSKNGNDYIWRAQHTGLGCAPPPDFEEVIVEGEACNGDYCEGLEARPGCGWLNDKYICTDNVGPNDCVVYPDGSRNCAGTAPTPPVPDNGTAGVPATPDGSIEICTAEDSCQTINNYNATTVDGSSRDPGGGLAPDDGPGSGVIGDGTGAHSGGDGDGDGEDGGEESVGGGDDCDAEPTCDGDVIDCAILHQEWMARCPVVMEESDMVEAFGETGNEDGEWLGSGTEVAFGEGGFDSSGFLGGGVETCLDDVEIVLGGDLPTVEIPLSTWCYWMHWLGLFLFLGANVGGIKIVVGGF